MRSGPLRLVVANAVCSQHGNKAWTVVSHHVCTNLLQAWWHSLFQPVLRQTKVVKAPSVARKSSDMRCTVGDISLLFQKKRHVGAAQLFENRNCPCFYCTLAAILSYCAIVACFLCSNVFVFIDFSSIWGFSVFICSQFYSYFFSYTMVS